MKTKKSAKNHTGLEAHDAITCRGRVLAVAENGELTVALRDDEPDGTACDVLESSPMSPAVYAVGDDVLVFDDGRDNVRPVVLGRVRRTSSAAAGRIELVADRELVLRCGSGAIVMRADGRIAITGLDIVSSAQRRQRIKGASVEIN